MLRVIKQSLDSETWVDLLCKPATDTPCCAIHVAFVYSLGDNKILGDIMSDLSESQKMKMLTVRAKHRGAYPIHFAAGNIAYGYEQFMMIDDFKADHKLELLRLVDDNGETALHTVARNSSGHNIIKVMRKWFHTHESWMEYMNLFSIHGLTALHIAFCSTSNPKVIETIFALCSPNERLRL